MWYFALRMLLVAIIAAVGLSCISVNTFGPMFTGYILLLVAGFWVVLELIAAVEQIVNAKNPVFTNCDHARSYADMMPYNAEQYRQAQNIINTPNAFSKGTVENAELYLSFWDNRHKKIAPHRANYEVDIDDDRL